MTLSFEQYATALGREFSVEGVLSPSTDLFDTLGFDSLKTMRLLVWTEDLAEVLFALEDPPLFTDVAGAYEYYLVLARQEEGRFPA